MQKAEHPGFWAGAGGGGGPCAWAAEATTTGELKGGALGTRSICCPRLSRCLQDQVP